jgi:tellurite resistance protein
MIIAVLSALAGLIWALSALQRSGFDLNSLNPFLAWRRWQWRQSYGNKPLYKLDRPIDVGAVLVLGIAKADGEITSEQKKALLGLFQSEFDLSRDAAAELLLASSHLIRDELYLVDRLDKILEPSAKRFERDTADSLLDMMRRIAALDGSINSEQQKLLDATERYFAARFQQAQRRWA